MIIKLLNLFQLSRIYNLLYEITNTVQWSWLNCAQSEWTENLTTVKQSFSAKDTCQFYASVHVISIRRCSRFSYRYLTQSEVRRKSHALGKTEHYHLKVQANFVQKNRCYFQYLWEKRDYPMTFFLNFQLGLSRSLRLNDLRC